MQDEFSYKQSVELHVDKRNKQQWQKCIYIYITRVKCIKQEMRGGILLCGHEIDFPFPNLSRSLLSSSSSRWDDQNLTHKKTRSEKYISPKLETSYSYRYRFTPPLPQPKRKRIITSTNFIVMEKTEGKV